MKGGVLKKDAKIGGQKKNKKLNVNQNKSGVDRADCVAGTIAFGSIRKKKFLTPINLELEFLKISKTKPNPKKPAEFVEAGVTEKVARLKEDEADRLGKAKQPKEFEALKAFTLLSLAIFEIND